MSATSHAGLIWDIAELLRGHYKRHENGDVILPLTVIRRLDCVLAPTREAVQEEIARLGDAVKNKDPFLKRAAGVPFYNTSRFDLPALLTEPNDLAANLNAYLNAFSPVAREIVEKFTFSAQIERLDRAGILYLVVRDFASVDLHPDRVSNRDMGIIYEELIRRSYEQSNEEAGDHFTPREVVRLMVKLLLGEDMDDVDGLPAPYAIRTLYDPACGTGGMLTVAEEFVRDFNSTARLELFGQEINEHTYATCKADMLLKGQNPNNITLGNTLKDDHHEGARFDYLLSNPPYGVDWKSAKDAVEHEHRTKGIDGRFGAGLPPIDDGQLLFLQHMIAKMKPTDAGGSRIAIIMNGSPLFSGNAGGGESNIRQWIIEHDWLEGIVALPTQLFYNTDIATYIWLVTNRKRSERRGQVQIVDATGMYRKMRKSLGKKRNEIVEDDLTAIARLYHGFAAGEHCKVFPNEAFGYRQIRVERPLRRSFAVTRESVEKVKATTQFQALVIPKANAANPALVIAEGEETQRRILRALASLDEERFADVRSVEVALTAAYRAAGVNPPAALRKAVLDALGERDEAAPPETDSRGHPLPDPNLRDTENVPLTKEVAAYMAREVLPFVPDAWMDESKERTGYEINITRYFYEYQPLRPLAEIDAEIKALEDDVLALLHEVTA